MTIREQDIIKAILDAGHDGDGHQYGEPTLHALANSKLQQSGKLAATLGEFNAALAIIGQHGWMTRVINRITNAARWNINDAGEAARLEL